MKVLICDYIGNAAQWIDENFVKENLEIVGTISPDTDKKLLTENSWEYLLIFEEDKRPLFNTLMQFMNIAPKRVIFAFDAVSWAMHPAAMYTLLKPQGGGLEAYRILTFQTARKLNYFVTCTTVEGLNYIATSKDNAIMPRMSMTRRTWAEDNIQIFKMFTQIFYHDDDSSGLFLDLGANIGTTGIYFLEKIAPNLKLLAFEPDPENFKLLRANLILNDLYEKAVVENYGLGAEEGDITFYKVPSDPGLNGMFASKSENETETVEVISLDKYFADNKLSPKDIKYIWIDTEGFESQVLLGAKNILSENPAPVFMEFNPQRWNSMGNYEEFVGFLKEFYAGYIWISEMKRTEEVEIKPIEELLTFRNSKAGVGSLGDIFLIHELKDLNEVK